MESFTPLSAALGGGLIGLVAAVLCAGPAISLITFLPDNLWIFLLAMFAGSLAGSVLVPSGHSKRLVDAQ